jgi:CBS domain-containing protein
LTAKELITDIIEPLKTSDTGKDALRLMNDYKVSHLPIVNNEKLLGLISEKDIYDFNEFEEPLGNHPLSLTACYVYEWQHIFEILKLAESLKLTLIPVIDKNETYLGSVLSLDLIFRISQLFMLDKPGALFILEMSINDYVLTEIANIIESNNAKILTSAILHQPDTTKIDLVLKVNTIEVNSILKTFERYNYQVKAVYDEQSDQEGLKERYDMLMKYLDV